MDKFQHNFKQYLLSNTPSLLFLHTTKQGLLRITNYQHRYDNIVHTHIFVAYNQNNPKTTYKSTSKTLYPLDLQLLTAYEVEEQFPELLI